MNVEIELEELCELKRQAKSNGYTVGSFISCAPDGCVGHQTLTRDKDGIVCSVGYLIAEIERLEKELAAYEPEDHESNWVPVVEHEKLKKERDWWKERAQDRTNTIDEVKRSLRGYSTLGLSRDAKCHGYNAD